MNKYVKEFIHRGLIFGGFGPIILGIIYAIVSSRVTDFTLTAKEVCLGICSIYILAFLQAGASLFNQIEHWPIMKSVFWHFSTIYLAYLLCYLINSWIPFDLKIVLLFTAIFIVVYLIVWLTVIIILKNKARNFNAKL